MLIVWSTISVTLLHFFHDAMMIVKSRDLSLAKKEKKDFDKKGGNVYPVHRQLQSAARAAPAARAAAHMSTRPMHRDCGIR